MEKESLPPGSQERKRREAMVLASLSSMFLKI